MNLQTSAKIVFSFHIQDTKLPIFGGIRYSWEKKKKKAFLHHTEQQSIIAVTKYIPGINSFSNLIRSLISSMY